MSKLNILGIVKGIKAQTTYLTPIIEAVCNSIDSIGNRPNGSIDIIAIRDGQKSFNDKEDSACVSIIGFDVIGNGVCFTETNRDSFDTYLSGHKYESGGKGFGRFMYLNTSKKFQLTVITKLEKNVGIALSILDTMKKSLKTRKTNYGRIQILFAKRPCI